MKYFLIFKEARLTKSFRIVNEQGKLYQAFIASLLCSFILIS